MALYTFDPEDVVVSCSGAVLEAIGPDGVTISSEYDIFEEEDGINGDVMISRNRRLRGTVSINLMTASDEDLAFDQLRAGPVDAFILIIRIKSLNKLLTSLAWYKTAPDLVVNTGAPSRTHVLGVENASLSYYDSASTLIDSISSAL